MEVAEIALLIDEVLAKKTFVGPLYYRFSWDKLVCLVPDKDHLSDLERYRKRGVKILYVASRHLGSVNKQGMSFAGIRYGPKLLIGTEKHMHLLRLLNEAFQRLQQAGVRLNRTKKLKSEVTALIYLLSTNPILAEPLTNLLDLSPHLVRHSMEVALLAQKLSESTGIEPTEDDMNILLLGLIHDLGKAHLPDDLREKNRSQLSKTEHLISRSFSQNLSIMVERDPGSNKNIKDLVTDYDRLERGEIFLPYESQLKGWLVIIANRIAEYILPESHFSSSGKFKEALSVIESIGFGLPPEVVRSFQDSLEGRWKHSA